MRFKPEDFRCEICGDTPEYIVMDGKVLSPSWDKIDHLEELRKHPDDDNILSTGSIFKDRVVLSQIRERKLVG